MVSFGGSYELGESDYCVGCSEYCSVASVGRS